MEKKSAATPTSSKSAPKTTFTDPLSISDPLSGGVSVDFDGSDPLSMIMKTESSPAVVGKSGRRDSIKVWMI